MDLFLVSIFAMVVLIGWASGILVKTPTEKISKWLDSLVLRDQIKRTDEEIKPKEEFRDGFKSTINNYNKAKEILESKKEEKNETVPKESKEETKKEE